MRLPALILVLSAALGAARAGHAGDPASASQKAVCVAAYGDGQKARDEGKLRAAKAAFEVCAADACPDVTKKDCTIWHGEVEAALPSLSFVVKDAAGADVNALTVTMDGEALATRLDGKAIPVDPGTHTFRFEKAGEAPVVREVLVREGEKARKVEVVIGAVAGPTPGAGAGSGGISPATWVLAGVGGAGLVVFGVLGGLGLSAKSDAEATCMPHCSDAVVDPIRAKFIGADVALSIGLASLAAGLTVGLVTGLDHEPSAGGGTPTNPGPTAMFWGVWARGDGAGVRVGAMFR